MAKNIVDHELEECPECGSPNLDGEVVFYDRGKMSRDVECMDCNDYTAVEYWEIERTEVV